MNQATNLKSIWFVYDGECPLCQTAATALRIKQDYGTLHLVNARTPEGNKLIQEINARGYDLDEGMVIYDGEHFYHGKDALRFMAKYAANTGLFNLINKSLFWSNHLATTTYPWMRGVRNQLLRKNKVSRIDNLNLKKEPIFKSIFGDSWYLLPPVMHKHYANRPYTKDVTLVEGTMDITCAGPIKLFAPLLRLVGSIPPHSESNVAVSVHFESEMDTKAFRFIRFFHFKNHKPYRFQSHMLQIKNNEVIEIMRFGLAWRMQYIWEDDRVKLKHKGYVLKLFDYWLPLPLTLLFGATNAEEIAVDDNIFDMCVQITHPWWGQVYEYKGRFEIKAMP